MTLFVMLLYTSGVFVPHVQKTIAGTCLLKGEGFPRMQVCLDPVFRETMFCGLVVIPMMVLNEPRAP